MTFEIYGCDWVYWPWLPLFARTVYYVAFLENFMWNGIAYMYIAISNVTPGPAATCLAGFLSFPSF